MNRTTQKQAQKIIGLITVMLVLFGANTFGFQGGISPLSDYMYKKDYQQYEEIKKEADAQKQADLLIAFLKERPISRVLLYVASDYLVVANKLAGSNTDKIISMTEDLQKLVPTDQQIKAAEIPVGVEDFRKSQLLPTRSLVLRQLAGAYSKKQNFQKAAELTEQAYAITPDKALVQTLYDIYTKLGNEAKILSYGKKMLEAYPMNQRQGYTTALQLVDIYIKKQDMNAALDLFAKLMNVYGNSVPPDIPEANWNQTRIFAYTLMARDAYSKNDYAKAEKLFQTVLSFNSRLDEPYYYLGMCKWKAKDQPAAIVYFARCTVLNKDYAARAQKYLEDLYKATYPNEPDGLPDVLDKAKSDLGL